MALSLPLLLLDAPPPAPDLLEGHPLTATGLIGLLVGALVWLVKSGLLTPKAASPATTPDSLSDLGRRLMELAEMVKTVSELKTSVAVLQTKQEHTTNILESLVDLQEQLTRSRLDQATTGPLLASLRADMDRMTRMIDEMRREINEIRHPSR